MDHLNHKPQLGLCLPSPLSCLSIHMTLESITEFLYYVAYLCSVHMMEPLFHDQCMCIQMRIRNVVAMHQHLYVTQYTTKYLPTLNVFTNSRASPLTIRN